MEINPLYVVVVIICVGYIWYKIKQRQDDEKYFEQDDED
jgi:hypothetical protein